MDWIMEFKWLFLFSAGLWTLIFTGGWFADNLSYPWKHWTREQTIGAFLGGPTLGLSVTGLAMVIKFSHSAPERLWTAASFLFLAFWLFGYVFPPVNPEEKERRRLMREHSK